MTIGERIRNQRKLLKMSQDELAVKVGYESRSSISKIESGEDDISVSKFREIASVLGVNEKYLLGYDRTQEKLKKIVELLDGKGTILVRNDEKDIWYVHCWRSDVNPRDTSEERITSEIYNKYVLDLIKALDEIIEKLEVKKDGI